MTDSVIMMKAFVLASILLLGACNKDKKPEAPKETEKATEKAGPEVNSNDSDLSTDSGPSANLNDIIYFEFDSSDLSSSARALLEENAKWLQEDEARIVTIEGHTDEVGTPEYNLGLGQKRAQSAKEYLVRLGIDATRIKVITYGEERPAGSEDAANRRSVFVATKQ